MRLIWLIGLQIVMEYCSGGSLADLLTLRMQPFNEEEVQMIVAYVLIGLISLHAMKSSHRVPSCTRNAISAIDNMSLAGYQGKQFAAQ